MNFWVIWFIVMVGFFSIPVSFLLAGCYIGWKLAALLVD